MKKISVILVLLWLAGPLLAQDNSLTKRQKKKGWILLFDGKTTQGWRNYRKETIGEAWKVEDGCLKLAIDGQKAGFQTKAGGDIITHESYENYELELEWKIAQNGNSGIIFNVVEDAKYQYAWQTGPEMQVLDNAGHPDSKIVKHRAGDLYDLISSSVETVKPFGEWNKVRLVNSRGLVEFFLNGTKVVSVRIDDDNWKQLIAGSKFKSMTAFGMSPKGHICLQDHGDMVWYKNIKLRKL
jgi:Domain of Unknown Function (DUF1080)